MYEEISIRSDEIDEPLETIYFGGGTPSILTLYEISEFLERISNNFRTESNIEITLEANPEDISKEVLSKYHKAGVNRISLGIQTLDDRKLKFLNRLHDARTAEKSIHVLAESQIDNFSIDLIYAIPPYDIAEWEHELSKILSFQIPHFSIYGLTIENKTVLGNWAQKNKFHELSDQQYVSLYNCAEDMLTGAGFEHYEVSNYAQPGFKSRHNTAYWLQKKYLGIGPGAHSYNGSVRKANISNNAQYIRSIAKGELPITPEELSVHQTANEYILTRTRTNFGMDNQYLESQYSLNLMRDKKPVIDHLISEDLIKVKESMIYTTRKGMLFADEIALKLFYDE